MSKNGSFLDQQFIHQNGVMKLQSIETFKGS